MTADGKMPPWLKGDPGQWILVIHAQPGASTSAVLGEHGGALKIRIAAPPVDGRANETLLRWLSLRLAVPTQRLALASGASSRLKRVRIASPLSADEVIRRLLVGAT